MERRHFVQTLGAAALGATAPLRLRLGAKPMQRIGLELFAVRDSMEKNPEATLAAVRAIGYTDVELLWSFGNFGRTDAQVKTTLDANGLRAPSCHMNPTTILVGWERSCARAKFLGQDYLFVPVFTTETERTLDDWKEWADKFNAAGAVARKYGLWVGFHNEPFHMNPIGGVVPYDVFMDRVDPTVTRHQLDVGNMLMGGGDPMAYLAKYGNKYWSFHLKDVTPDRKSDTYLGQGTFDLKKFLQAVPNLDQKPAYVEHESPADDVDAARRNWNYLHSLEL